MKNSEAGGRRLVAFMVSNETRRLLVQLTAHLTIRRGKRIPQRIVVEEAIAAMAKVERVKWIPPPA